MSETAGPPPLSPVTGLTVTLKVDGIRYLEKPPLPYWITAGFYRAFGENVFATRLPNSLANSIRNMPAPIPSMPDCKWTCGM